MIRITAGRTCLALGRPFGKPSRLVCSALPEVLHTRRSSILTGLTVGWTLTSLDSVSWAAKLPKGFSIVQDKSDGYQYLAPFGWQEVDVEGLDSVYKDLIEPLESVSVSIIPTDKKSVSEFGSLKEVAANLADKVLTPPDQKVKLLDTSERTVEGIQYYSFEFTTQAPNYSRHALAVVAVGNGNFYTLTIGASERRFKKVEERLRTVTKSFQVIEINPAI